MIRIEIGRRNYLLYLLLPHRMKSRLLTPASRAKLDRINRAFNETLYSGAGASSYDRIHRYAEDEQHEYPARPLVADILPEGGYGRALEVGAGSGYLAAELPAVVPTASVDTAFVIQSLHHLHDREWVFVFRHWAAVLAIETRRLPESR